MRYFSALIFAALLTVLAGCGDKKPPPPPTAHVLLVKKLFENLAKHQHTAAYKRVQKVRALDPGNEFLIQIEEREYCNSEIEKAQKMLDKNRVKDALSLIKEARKKLPLNRNLLAVENELKMLQDIKEHIKLLNIATTSRQMNLQINYINNIIKKYTPAETLTPLLRKKIKLAFKTSLAEKERARFDLLCDLRNVRNAKRPNASLSSTLEAVLKVDNDATVNKNERVKATLLN
jgi:predicted small lipoprotein YifL